ncbi:MAG: TatD family hydrolase [Rhodospirillales bacterium]
MPTPLVDSHCHLDFPDFEDDLDQVLARASAAGVGWMLSIGTQVSRFDNVLRIANSRDNIFCTVGVHPHEAAKEPEITPQHLIRMAGHPKVVGLGESGLDYHYEHSPREAQQKSFKVHIEAARISGLPIVVHTREAEEDTLDILAGEMAAGPFKGLIHCFSSGPEFAARALDLGLYISFSGILTFKQADRLRQTAKNIPMDRILVETDAPYLAPAPKRGKRNEPAYVALTAARLAEIKGVDPDTLAGATTDNFFELFAKAGDIKAGDMQGEASCG